MPRAVEGDHNTRLTLAVPPSDQGMFALAVGEGAADWLSAAAKGPTRSFPADCSSGPPDKLSLRLAATAFGSHFTTFGGHPVTAKVAGVTCADPDVRWLKAFCSHLPPALLPRSMTRGRISDANGNRVVESSSR